MISRVLPFSTQVAQVQRNDVRREMLHADQIQRQIPKPSVNPVPFIPNYRLPLGIPFLRLEHHPETQDTNFTEIPESEPPTNYLMNHGYSQGVQKLTFLAELASQATGNPFKARLEIEKIREPYQKVLAI